MSVTSDLAAAFAEPSLTVPVLYGASSTRGYFDRAGTIKKVGNVGVPLEQDTLHIQKGTLPALVTETQITVGVLGAASAVGGVLFRVANIYEIDDGEILAVELAGGES